MLIERLASFFEGEVRFLLKTAPETAVNLFLSSGISYYKEERLDNGYAISLTRKDSKDLTDLCAQKNISFEILYEKGLFPFFRHLLSRPGLVLGVLLALFILYQSSQYVWQIRVYGTEELSYSQVVDILKEHGFHIGSRFKSIDMHMLCNTVPIHNDRIAWISVNMMGSVAEVHIVENRPAPDEKDPEKEEGLVNLVATAEGQIVGFELSSGRVVAGIGKTVARGELLVAGFSEKETGLHPRVSAGKVFARTTLFEEVFVPYNYTEKQPEEPEMLSKTLMFLEKSVNIFKNSRFSAEEYDIMINEYSPTVMGISLPLRISEVYAKTYRTVEMTRSKEQAEKLARELLYQRINEKTEQLLEDRFFLYPEEEGLRVVLAADCVMNIATPVRVVTEPDS